MAGWLTRTGEIIGWEKWGEGWGDKERSEKKGPELQPAIGRR